MGLLSVLIEVQGLALTLLHAKTIQDALRLWLSVRRSAAFATRGLRKPPSPARLQCLCTSLGA